MYPLRPAQRQAILPGYDLVVVTDYGHGMLTPEIIELLQRNNIEISRALAGPRSWAGAHPEERD